MGSLFGGGGPTDGDIERAAAQSQFQGFDFTGPFGSVDTQFQAGEGTINIQPGQDSAIALFQALLPGLAQQFQGTQAVTDVGAAPQVGLEQLFANVRAAAAPTDFDAQGFTQQQFERLNQMARQGEQTAASQTADQLFARGRLGAGDSASGRVFAELERAQQEARTGRAIQAIGLADTEQQRLERARDANVRAALQAFGAGGNLFGLLRDDQFARAEFRNQARRGLFGELLGATEGVNVAAQPLFTQLQAALTASGQATGAAQTRASAQLGGLGSVDQGGGFGAGLFTALGTGIAGPVGGAIGAGLAGMFE